MSEYGNVRVGKLVLKGEKHKWVTVLDIPNEVS